MSLYLDLEVCLVNNKAPMADPNHEFSRDVDAVVLGEVNSPSGAIARDFRLTRSGQAGETIGRSQKSTHGEVGRSQESCHHDVGSQKKSKGPALSQPNEPPQRPVMTLQYTTGFQNHSRWAFESLSRNLRVGGK